MLLSLDDELLCAIARLLPDEDRLCLRLTCMAMWEHCEPASTPISRLAFLRTRSLAAYACDELPDFVLADRTHMLALAATVGGLAVLAELMDVRGCNGQGAIVRAYGAAASHGRLEALVWLRARNPMPDYWGVGMCERSAEGGHLEVLRYLHEQGVGWWEDTCAAAAQGGHLDVLRYAREHGCPWDEDTCAKAAERGHLAVLQWARANGCPWDYRTCECAAHGGHLAVLQWAHAHDCPWSVETCAAAALAGHLAVLQWARAHGCP